MCDCDYFMTQEILEGFTQEISARQGKVTETFHQTGQLFVRSVLPQAEEIRARDKVQSGVALRATDTDWQHGSGPEVTGPMIALLLAMTGRKAALDDLKGDGAAVLRERN